MFYKEELCAIMNFAYDYPIDIEAAWAAYNRFNRHIQSADLHTIKYFLKIICYTDNELLSLRNIMAESGKELTPSELSQYIFILSICFFDRLHQTIDTQKHE
jgi:hypothetical protein